MAGRLGARRAEGESVRVIGRTGRPNPAATSILIVAGPKTAFAVGPPARYAVARAEYSEFLGERMPTIVSRAAAETFARLR